MLAAADFGLCLRRGLLNPRIILPDLDHSLQVSPADAYMLVLQREWAVFLAQAWKHQLRAFRLRCRARLTAIMAQMG